MILMLMSGILFFNKSFTFFLILKILKYTLHASNSYWLLLRFSIHPIDFLNLINLNKLYIETKSY